MKYLTILALCVFSFVSYAQASQRNDFDKIDQLGKAKILGTWQCQGGIKRPEMDSDIVATMHFLPNNTLYIHKISHISIQEANKAPITGTYDIKTTRSWLVWQNNNQQWILDDEIITVDSFSIDNPELEKELTLKQYLDAKPYSTTRINVLTDDTLAFGTGNDLMLNCKKVS